MFKRFITTGLILGSLVGIAGIAGPLTHASPRFAQEKPALQQKATRNADRDQRLQRMVAAAVRHELVTLPYYNVFDWLEAELRSDGTVILQGEAVEPTTSKDAENRIRKIESVNQVINQIKILPVSVRDSELRLSLYRAIYNWDSPLFRYATRAMPPIHILVENGRVTLKGAVATQSERQLAYTAANQVPGIFEVRNELQTDN